MILRHFLKSDTSLPCEYHAFGEGPPVFLLHGMFGGIENWEHLIHKLSDRYTLIVPELPLHQRSKVPANMPGLADMMVDLIRGLGYEQCTLIGNSLGGQLGAMISVKAPELMNGLVLTGSAGLWEPGKERPLAVKRRSMDFVREKVAITFYDPSIVTEALVQEVYDRVNDASKLFRMLKIARSCRANVLRSELPKINTPVLLIWGKEDEIAPLNIAREFDQLIPDSKLVLFNKCGHVPMMEHPKQFVRHLTPFLDKVWASVQTPVQRTVNGVGH